MVARNMECTELHGGKEHPLEEGITTKNYWRRLSKRCQLRSLPDTRQIHSRKLRATMIRQKLLNTPMKEPPSIESHCTTRPTIDLCHNCVEGHSNTQCILCSPYGCESKLFLLDFNQLFVTSGRSSPVGCRNTCSNLPCVNAGGGLAK